MSVRLAVAAGVVAALAGRAGAEERTDWVRGLVIARGAAAGDLRAPSAAVARVAAERQAREAAREKARAIAVELPVADGRKVSAVIDADAVAKQRFERAVGRSIDVRVDYASDGSVVLETGLPVDAIRTALWGADEVVSGTAGDTAVTALIVDARKLKVSPAIGIELAAGSERYRGPTVFVGTPADAKKDARAGNDVVQASASKAEAGTLTVDVDPGKLAAARRAGALVLVAIKKNKK